MTAAGQTAGSLAVGDVFAARRRIAPYVRRTPLARSAWLSDITGGDVALKLESVQLSNSFKSRGAFNAVIARLERHPGTRQLVTASAGNHGRALAAAAEAFHLPIVVFTSKDAAQTKLLAIRRHGATLRAEGRDYDDAERMAKAYAADTGGEFVSPYNDRDVIAGAATVALELLEDRPAVSRIVVPIGGGGLISGVAATAKAINAGVMMIGVEAEASCAFQTSVRAGRLVEIVPGPTLADGLGGNPDPDTITFAFIRRHVDSIVTVSEHEIERAIVGLVDAEHLIAEGAGAVATAALMARKIDVAGRETIALLTGANIDRRRLATLIASR